MGDDLAALGTEGVGVIVEELTGNGIMGPGRLYESPYVDHGHVDVIFPTDYEGIVEARATSRRMRCLVVRPDAQLLWICCGVD